MPVTYRPDGAVDRTTARAFRARARDAIDDAPDTTVVVDFANVEFMDSTAFSALEQCGVYALDRGGALVIASLPRAYEPMVRLLRWALAADEERALIAPDACRGPVAVVAMTDADDGAVACLLRAAVRRAEWRASHESAP